MKAVWGRFWGNPVNARQELSGLQKCNILADVRVSQVFRSAIKFFIKPGIGGASLRFL